MSGGSGIYYEGEEIEYVWGPGRERTRLRFTLRSRCTGRRRTPASTPGAHQLGTAGTAPKSFALEVQVPEPGCSCKLLFCVLKTRALL